MSELKKIKTVDGKTVEYYDTIIGSGGMKDVYFTVDKKNVVALFRDKQDYRTLERLDCILNNYNPTRDPELGNYWKELFCWPTMVIKDNIAVGIVAPRYPDHFYFQKGINKGHEKEGKWFASAKLRKYIDPSEVGDRSNYYAICILLSRAIRRMHAAGLAHSDLSYKNVLIDPKGEKIQIIDIDSLVVPKKFPPDVLGTPDFIAPEVYMTLHLDLNDKNRKLPSRYTDLHALSVLIYMYLLYRHPLRGKKVYDNDPAKDEFLSMGSKALFIEHPSDKSNASEKDPRFLPWSDTDKLPYTIVGPYVSKLFEKAFIEGLHNPLKRPIADEWENALIKTLDLLIPCSNVNCTERKFVFMKSRKLTCPFCGTKYTSTPTLPYFEFYSSHKEGRFTSENHQLVIYHNQSIYPWHINKNISRNEKLTENFKKRVGYFSFVNNKWYFINKNLKGLKNITTNKNIPIDKELELVNGEQILLSGENGGRVVLVNLLKTT